ncbi:MAG: hypothetical protein HJHJAOHD_01386 [Flavobacteriales bacterium]|nr:hypothetical protein [Flavobacteriales bacterium]WKZ75333.1 MAG: hypothetical protein QY303_00265 [Vicingaceae bacterium]
MKKFLSMIMIAGLFSMVACGPSEEEKAAAEAEAEKLTNELMQSLDQAVEESEATAEEAPAEEAPAEEAPAEEATK